MNATAANATEELQTAGLARRSAAAALDAIPAAFIVALCFAFDILDAGIFRPDDGWFWTEWIFKYWLDDRGALVWPIVVFFAVAIGWTTVWELACRRSPGARITHLLVVDRSAFRIQPARALLRGLGAALNVATLGLGYLWVFVSSYRRGWHDYVAGTFVVVEQRDDHRPKTGGDSKSDAL